MASQEAAEKLASELEQIARDVRAAGNGDEEACIRVRNHMDKHWNAIVVGTSQEIEAAISTDEEDACDLARMDTDDMLDFNH
jgi:hypothetical protein